jgi:hypothetical protein
VGNTCHYGKATRVPEAHGKPFLLLVNMDVDDDYWPDFSTFAATEVFNLVIIDDDDEEEESK